MARQEPGRDGGVVRRSSGLLAAVLLAALPGCAGSGQVGSGQAGSGQAGSQQAAPGQAGAPAPVDEAAPLREVLVVPELGVRLRAPRRARDLVYVMGLAPEGQPAAFFSTAALARAGGPSCAAGATAAVSPYPLGRVVLAQETPVQVRLETAVDPEDSLGEPLGRVAAGWLYYAPPPEESCNPDAPSAGRMQARQVVLVHEALRRATAAG